MAIAGKVMFLPRGDYSAEQVYDILDVVLHDNKPWVCKKNNTVGVEPSKSNSDYWMMLVDVDITNADTLGGHKSDYFLSKEELANAFKSKTVLFSAAEWIGDEPPYTQTVEVSGIKETDEPIPIFVDDGTNATETKNKEKAYACISYYDSANGYVTATCKYEKPEVDVSVALKGVFPAYEILPD